MTAAHQAIVETECIDLQRALDSAERRICELKACKFRLNGLIVKRDEELARLYAANAALRNENARLQDLYAEQEQELALRRAGRAVDELPY